jgi:hypothetical protein
MVFGTGAEEGVSKLWTGTAGFNSVPHYTGMPPPSAFTHCCRVYAMLNKRFSLSIEEHFAPQTNPLKQTVK